MLGPEVSRQHPLFGQFVVYFGHAGLFVLLTIVASMVFRRNGRTNRARLAALIAFYVSSAVLSWFFVVNGALKTMY
jgi:TctA family transporter